MLGFVEFVVVGFLIGSVVGALGAGGGILSLPALSILLGLSAHQASTGSLIVVGLTALVSLVSRAKSGSVLWREGIFFGVLGLVGAAGGAKLSFLVPEAVLMTAFGILLLAVSVATFRKSYKKVPSTNAAADDDNKINLIVLVIAASCTGFLTGFFGVGGGFIIVPALLFIFKITIRQAAGTSVLVMVIVSAISLLTRVGGGIDLPWTNLVVFAVASMVGALVGHPVSNHVSESTLTRIFAVLLFIISLVTFSRIYL